MYNTTKGGIFLLENYLKYFSAFLAKYSQYSEEVLNFCLKLWLSTIFQIVVLFLIANIFFDIWFCFMFIVVFCSMRTVIWGYHCKTFINCLLLTTGLYVLIGIFSKVAADVGFALHIGAAISLISLIYLIINSIRSYKLKANHTVKYKTFFVVRLALILIFGISAIIFSHKIWLNNTVHIWNFICTYCLVAILTLMQGGDNYEENGKG